MCGIFGYVGSRPDAGGLVIEGLKNLEYRGYDSWGVAWKEGSAMEVRKDTGKISHLNPEDFGGDTSHIAIAHTRWATHGGVTKVNAHPHLSCDGTIAVIHNGIVENFDELKKELTKKGHTFLSETDTEVVAHLVEEEMKKTNDFGAAFRQACIRCKGRNAFLALHTQSQTLVAARTGSPLIVGVGSDGYYIASDTPAFLKHTRTVQYIDDGEMVVTDGKHILFYDIATGEERMKREIAITWNPEQAEKGDYAHYMLKEIMDQKESVARAVNQDEKDIETVAKAINEAKGTFLVGCGTAGKACMAAEYFFSVVAEKHVNFAPASEFKLYHHFLKPESLLIVVSQSGETADVLEAMRVAKSKGSKVLAIVNVQGSTIAREADYTVQINAGPERAVASTKALTGQLAVLLLIAYALTGKLKEGKKLLLETSSMINDMLNPRYVERLRQLSELIKRKEDLYIIGKSWNYPMALESAIKIQEVSYIHAEGFAGGELKHGPIALIEQGTPCIALMGKDEVTTDMISNATQLKSRGGFVIGVSPQKYDAFNEWIKVPDAGNAQAIVNIIPIQVLAYFLAVQRGKDPDMPRNLAKSVTVK
ncbi:glutamine--fructose-6-phosphate transaminase (isomerizing) [Candidatus Peregrinibacteria bacterium]|nr:glutamine--fructose-6-phosphate transaminase (isomerizing) [Candidatus Peregrinibacteria bacterium]